MLALGMLIVHVALEIRVGSRFVALLQRSDSSEVGFIVTFDVGCVVLNLVMGSGDPVGPTPVGCAFPFRLGTRLSMSTENEGLEDDDTGGTLGEVATEDRLIGTVTLEYGAERLD
jgi:hypothetical protein